MNMLTRISIKPAITMGMPSTNMIVTAFCMIMVTRLMFTPFVYVDGFAVSAIKLSMSMSMSTFIMIG